MKQFLFLMLFSFLTFVSYSQEPTLEDATSYLKEKIEFLTPMLGSKTSVKVDKCKLEIYDIYDSDTTAYTYINLGEINDSITYSKRQVLGYTTITISGPGVYTISYGDILNTENKGVVMLGFKTKNFDRIEFVNSFSKALLVAKNKCKSKF